MQLAQLNVGRAAAPLDSEQLRDFMENLEPINALADASPGFVWRLQTEDGNATAVRPYADDRIMINMSVWADHDSLRAYVFRSAHAAVMRRRREWFERFEGIYAALWWVPAGHRPSVEEAVSRIAHLEAHGSTSHAFSFREPFNPDGRVLLREQATWDDTCPA